MSAPTPEQRHIQIARLLNRAHSLYPDTGLGARGWLVEIKKQLEQGEASNQKLATGRKTHPADFERISQFKIYNEYHSTCIHTKTESTVGLGHTQKKVAETLDPLCRTSWQETLNAVTEDFWQTGNGYLEVVRESEDPTSRVTGLHHLSSAYTFINVEDELANIHFEVSGRSSTVVSSGQQHGSMGDRRFAAFGDAAGFRSRNSDLVSPDKRLSEVIHLRQPTSLNRWYGFPRWIAATASMELMQALTQERFDFFINRGVPEFILWVLGTQVGKKDWEAIQNAMDAQIGLQNSHKSMAINLPDVQEGDHVRVDKLDAEHKPDAQMFSDMTETLALKTVSAHQVPPLLAGILIPGKLGATNELPNAIKAFQLLTISPAQNIVESTLNNTLGDSRYGVDGLDRDDFEFKKLTDELDLDAMDTSARMRQTEPEAAAEGRDLRDWVRKAEDLPALTDEQADVLAQVLGKSLERLAPSLAS